jgi:hypothetical protein
MIFVAFVGFGSHNYSQNDEKLHKIHFYSNVFECSRANELKIYNLATSVDKIELNCVHFDKIKAIEGV